MPRSRPALLLIWLFAVVLGCGPRVSGTPPRADAGVLDLSAVDPAGGPYAVRGAWEGYWGELRSAAEFEPGQTAGTVTIESPGTWSGGTTSDGTAIDDIGAATLRMRVRLPAARDPEEPWMVAISTLNRAYVLEVRDLDGRPLITPLTRGQVGLDAQHTEHAHLGGRALLRPSTDEIELVLRTSAFYGRAKSEKLRVTIGPESTLAPWLAREEQNALIVFGVTLVMGLYHLCLFVLRRTERSPLYFGLFCLAIAMREFVQFDFLEARYPEIDVWALHNRLEYIGFFAAVPLFLAFLEAVFPRDFWSAGHRGLSVLTALAVGAVAVLPPDGVLRVLQVYEALTLVVVLYLLGALGRLIFRGQDRVLAWLIGIGAVVLISTVVNDILSNTGVVGSTTLSHYGVFAFIFFQSMVLAVRNQRARGRSEALAVELDRKNAALVRFVPKELLSLLGRRDVVDVELGDQSRREMTVLFCDIRGFTSISEQLGPAETFALLNGCLGRIAPIVRERGGFVDKYIGDALMALFPASPNDAVDAAQAIVAALASGPASGGAPGAGLSVGIGVHTGTMMLGTIGEPLRMEGTVISDAVNFASRLEGLTRYFDVAILLSAASVTLLDPARAAQTRSLGHVRVKGRQEAMEIVELYAADPPHIRALKHESRARFEAAVEQLRLGRFTEAGRMFEAIQAQNPEDGPALLFARRCGELQRMARPWRGVLEFDEK